MIWIVIKLSGETVVPMDYDQKEYWTWRPAGKKPWIFRAFSANRFWGHGNSSSEEDSRQSTGGFPLTEIREGDNNSISSTNQQPSAVPSTVEEKYSSQTLPLDTFHGLH